MKNDQINPSQNLGRTTRQAAEHYSRSEAEVRKAVIDGLLATELDGSISIEQTPKGLTMAAFAKQLGVSKAAVSKAYKRGAIKLNVFGLVDEEQTTYRPQKNAASGQPLSFGDLTSQKVRVLAADAALKEKRLAVQEGRLLPIAEVAAEWDRQLRILRATLEALAGSAADQVVADVVAQVEALGIVVDASKLSSQPVYARLSATINEALTVAAAKIEGIGEDE